MIGNLKRCTEMTDAELRARVIQIGARAVLGGFLLGCVAGWQIAHIAARLMNGAPL
jgi:hypothetical protein